MRKLILPLLLLVALTGFGCQSSQKTLIQACNTAATSLSTLANFNAQGRLSPALVATVDRVKAVTDPICSSTDPLPTGPVDAVQLVTPAVAQLTAIIAGVK